MCVNTMPRREDISNDLREAVVAAHQSVKGYKAINKLCGVHHATERKRLFTSGKLSRLWPVFSAADVPASSLQGQTVRCSEKLQKTQELHLRLDGPQLAC